MFFQKTRNSFANPTTITEYEFNNRKKEKEKLKNQTISDVYKGLFACNKISLIVGLNIVGILALGSVGLLVGLGITNISPKIIGSTCTSNKDCQVLSEYGLICNNGNCTCKDTAYFDGTTCLKKKTALVSCRTSDECDNNKYLYCDITNSTTKQCVCTSYQYWNGNQCVTLGFIGYTCTKSDQCAKSLGLECNKTCSCPAMTFWNGINCEKLRFSGATCISTSECDTTVKLYCPLTGNIVGICTCTNLYYWDNATSTCVQQKSVNVPCSTSSQCRNDLGLTCDLSGTCTCSSNYYWTGTICAVRAAKSSGCSTTMPCDSSLLLTCINGVCDCPSTHYWGGYGCIPKTSIGSGCSLNTQCLDPSGLICSSQYCVCSSTFYWDSTSSKCIAKITNGGSCSSTTQCQTNNLLSCVSGTCQCPYNYYWDGSICQLKLTDGSTCSYSDMCQTYLGLSCIKSVCSCSNTDYWNGANCVAKKSYTDTCSSSTECNDLIGLACSTTAGACDCPAKTIVNMCDCTSGYYYDYNQRSCVPQKLVNNTCTATYECKVSRYLSCVSGICQCPSGPLWFWSTSSSTCIECPKGWDIYKSHCYYVSRSALSWDNALSWCRNQNAEFMIVNDDDEYKLLYNYYVTFFGSGNLWIGAKSPTVFDFRWPDNTQLGRYSTWWCGGEPNNAGGNANYVHEGCVFMWTAGGRICFNDYPCWAACPFVCEKNN